MSSSLQRLLLLPPQVKASLEKEASGAPLLHLEGPRGKTSWMPPETFTLSLDLEKGHLLLKAPSLHRAFLGTSQALLRQTLRGLTQGFQIHLHLKGVGYRARMEGESLHLRVGYSHEVVLPQPEGVTILCPHPTRISLRGIDLPRLTQAAARIRAWRPPEPYKGKGIFLQGENLLRKEGKKT